ncbi:MAG: hypothetical protein LLG04_07920 [Parachlamydia sp.]|nr:hypothetical protein [Parachlamydia sp.]
MSTLMLTLVLAFVIVIIALALLAIGWLFTGKSRIQPGACGRAPHKKRSEEEGCGTSASCSICEKKDKTDVR